jgi:hypothetical protein
MKPWLVACLNDLATLIRPSGDRLYARFDHGQQKSNHFFWLNFFWIKIAIIDAGFLINSVREAGR